MAIFFEGTDTLCEATHRVLCAQCGGNDRERHLLFYQLPQLRKRGEYTGRSWIRWSCYAIARNLFGLVLFRTRRTHVPPAFDDLSSTFHRWTQRWACGTTLCLRRFSLSISLIDTLHLGRVLLDSSALFFGGRYAAWASESVLASQRYVPSFLLRAHCPVRTTEPLIAF